MAGETNWATAAFEAVKGHPREALGIACLLTGSGMMTFGVETLYAIAFPGGIFCVNGLVMWLQNNHLRYVAELDVKRLENEEGAAVRERARRSLGKRVKK